MGLDMYLYLEEYKSLLKFDNNFTDKKVENFYPKDLRDFAKQHIKDNFLSKITQYQVGYWRKFNALHNYIVKTFADGEDNCKDIYIGGIKGVKQILDICLKVQENRDLASELLPTQSGFFFGGLEYDEWYFKDLEYTIDLLQRVIELLKRSKEDYSVVYHASW